MEALTVSTATLDEQCKRILQHLLDAGYNKAGESYVIESGDFTASDFDYLLRHGAMRIANGDSFAVMSVLRTYAMPKFGPEVGKIGFELNFDLD